MDSAGHIISHEVPMHGGHSVYTEAEAGLEAEVTNDLMAAKPLGKCPHGRFCRC